MSLRFHDQCCCDRKRTDGLNNCCRLLGRVLIEMRLAAGHVPKQFPVIFSIPHLHMLAEICCGWQKMWMTPIPGPPSPPLPSSLIPFLRDHECKARVRTCTLVSHPSHALTLQNMTRHGTTSRLHWLETTQKKKSPSTKERVQCLPTAAWMLQ